MWAIKWDERPPAGKKLGVRGERGTDKNKTGWRGRNLFDLSHCGKQNSWRSPAVVKLLFFFFKSGCTLLCHPVKEMETISSRPAVSWHFDFNATSMIRGEKRKKKKIHDGKLVPISCFSCKTAHCALPQIFPYWQPLDGTQQDAPPPPNSWQNWGEQWDSDRTPVMKWFPESSRSSVHFLYVLFCAFFSLWTPHLNTACRFFSPQHRRNTR